MKTLKYLIGGLLLLGVSQLAAERTRRNDAPKMKCFDEPDQATAQEIIDIHESRYHRSLPYADKPADERLDLLIQDDVDLVTGNIKNSLIECAAFDCKKIDHLSNDPDRAERIATGLCLKCKDWWTTDTKKRWTTAAGKQEGPWIDAMNSCPWFREWIVEVASDIMKKGGDLGGELVRLLKEKPGEWVRSLKEKTGDIKEKSRKLWNEFLKNNPRFAKFFNLPIDVSGTTAIDEGFN